MKLPLVYEALCELPHDLSSDGKRVDFQMNDKFKYVPGNKYHPERRGIKRNDLTDRTIGRLHVDYLHHVLIEKGKRSGAKYRYYYMCTCECGNKTIVDAAHLKHNKISSCGCLHHDIMVKRATHHLTKTRLFSIWQGMIYRCYCERSSAYPNYGGRGIYICNEWYKPGNHGDQGFINFYNWSYANGYYDQPKDTPKKKRLTIDRIDNDGPYAPWNCRWVTTKIQCNNTRRNKYISDNDEVLSWTRMAEKYNKYPTYIGIRKIHNWSDDAIIYSMKHPDLDIRKNPNRPAGLQYVDQYGFSRLIPKIGSILF